MTNISNLAANASALDLALAEVRGEVKVTRLATKKAPQSGRRARNGRAVSSGVEYNGIAVGKGGMGNLNPVGGIGKQAPNNVAGVVANATRTYAEDRKAAARERAAERNAQACADLDDLLDDVRG